MNQNNENQIEDEYRSKRQKTTHECKLCYVDPCSATLKCGHEMCTECCIKHFRKTVNCPFCRAVICEKEDRTDEYKQIISDELHCQYKHLEDEYTNLGRHNDANFTMYEFLKFKGLNKKDAQSIIDSIKDRCLEMFKTSEEYTETLSTIKEDWEHQWDSSEDESEYEDEDKSESKSQEKE
jgi:hypothetical protein